MACRSKYALLLLIAVPNLNVDIPLVIFNEQYYGATLVDWNAFYVHPVSGCRAVATFLPENLTRILTRCGVAAGIRARKLRKRRIRRSRRTTRTICTFTDTVSSHG